MFADTLGMRLRGAYLTFHRRANAHFGQLGLTADQFVVLTILAEEEGLTQREIVARAFSDPNTVGEMLARLEHKRLVRRERHPRDGRARCVYLTPQGRKVQSRLWDGSEALRQELDDTLRDGERAAALAWLERVPPAMVSGRAPEEAIA